MIRFDNVFKRYPEHLALSNLTFELSAGEMVFVTGHSGAGKSTLLRLIGLMERPSHGRVVVNGCDLATLKRRRIPHYRRTIGMIFQDHRLLPDLSVAANVALPLEVAGVAQKDIERRVDGALTLVGLARRGRANPIALSAGERQRVGIARAIVSRPPVLLADEPTGNLDPKLSREIFELFERLMQRGVTILIASHDLELISRMGQRTFTLANGRLVSDTGA